MSPGINYEVVIYYDTVNDVCQLAINPSATNYNQVYSPIPGTPSTLVSGVTSDGYTPAALPMAAFGLRQAANVGVIDLDNLEVSDDWNGAGSGYTAVMAGIVPVKPVVGFISAGITNYTGNSNIIEAAASGIGLGYTWYQGATQLSDGGSITGSSTPVLTISPEVGSNSGNYTCVVTNSAGMATSSVVVVSINTTPTAPIFTSQPVSTTVPLGSTVTFTATAVGTGPIGAHGYTDGVANGSTGSSFTLTQVSTNLTGSSYSVVAANGGRRTPRAPTRSLTVTSPGVYEHRLLAQFAGHQRGRRRLPFPPQTPTTVYQVQGVVIEHTPT